MGAPGPSPQAFRERFRPGVARAGFFVVIVVVACRFNNEIKRFLTSISIEFRLQLRHPLSLCSPVYVYDGTLPSPFLHTICRKFSAFKAELLQCPKMTRSGKIFVDQQLILSVFLPIWSFFNLKYKIALGRP